MMGPAWLHALAVRPHLLAEHGQAYAQLVGEESALALAACRQQLLWRGGAALALLLGLTLAGMAGLLAAALPVADMPAAWLLVVIPLPPLVVGAVCWLKAGAIVAPGFARLREQLRADGDLLQAVLAHELQRREAP